ICLPDRGMATRSNSAEGSGPSSSRGRGKFWQGDPVKTTLDHTEPKSPRHFRPRLLPLSHFLFFSNFKFLTNAPLLNYFGFTSLRSTAEIVARGGSPAISPGCRS